jgi:hypothetical protein
MMTTRAHSQADLSRYSGWRTNRYAEAKKNRKKRWTA